MFYRQTEPVLQRLSRQYSVVTLLGPRQSGKSTLVRHVFAHKKYANLEDISTRRLALADPEQFLGQFPEGAILDEIQQAPELLSLIQVIVDARPEKGLFILTGSHQLALHAAIAQSLAGRTAMLTLFPMTLAELQQAGFEYTIDRHILTGCFPRIFQENLNPTEVYGNYYRTYVQRDVRSLLNVKNLNLFEKFLKLCAGRIGQIFSATALAAEVGVSYHTIQEWTSILEASYIIFRLQPFFANFGKRVIKSPKLYFTDVGLASYLLGIENVTQMARDPLRGNLFENLVILELVKYRQNQGKDPRLYYFRDNHGNEVDVIIQAGHQLIPVEIKSAQTFDSGFLKGLHYFQNLAQERVSVGVLIYAGEQEQNISSIALKNFRRANTIWEMIEEN